jgi:hypothetical protein
LIISKDQKKRIFLTLFFSLFFSVVIVRDNNTFNICLHIAETVNSIIIGFFGIAFMGYAFYQALMNDDFFKFLLLNNYPKKKDSYLEVINDYFFNYMILNLMIISVSLFFICIPKSFMKYIYFFYLKFIFLFCYMYLSINVIFEMKCFLNNLYMIFKFYLISKMKNNENSPDN